MVHSVLAVLAGFAVMAVVVMITTMLAATLILRLPLDAIRSGAQVTLSPAYLATNIAASGVAAIVGGYTTAVVAGHDRLLHGVGLAVLMVLMSLVSMRQAGAGSQPRWYRLVLATLMPALAIAGAAVPGLVAAT